MNKIFGGIVLVALTGCCSYSQLKTDVGQVQVDGRKPAAVYEVVNVSYKLLGLVPLTTGVTWKKGPYSDDVGSVLPFEDQCSLDDNLDSVRHACEIVGAEMPSDITGRVDEYFAWSLFLIQKRVVKTSCVLYPLGAGPRK